MRAPEKIVASELGLTIAEKSFDEIVQKLADRINELINTDLNQLIAVLYRMDISEKRLRSLLQNNEGKDAGRLIAMVMIEREAEKIKSREQFKQQDTDIDEDEKW